MLALKFKNKIEQNHNKILHYYCIYYIIIELQSKITFINYFTSNE